MKIFALHLLRKLGVFALFRYLNKNKAMILSYHAVEVADETDFRRQLFISKQTLNKRLDYLQQHFRMIPLSQLATTQAKNAVVITLNDGWYSNLALAAPLLKQHQIPYTVYLTGEGDNDGQPIFHVGLSYILTKNAGKQFKYQHPSGVAIDEVLTRERVDPLIELIEPTKSCENDTELLLKIAESLDFDFQPSIENKAFTLLTTSEVKQLAQMGADLQMHTHSLDTPLDSVAAFSAKLEKNRQYIESVCGKTPSHYCYPAGTYQANTVNYLNDMGVDTARTTNVGLVDNHTPHLELPSFADSENIPQIVFEAEMCGLMSFIKTTLKGKPKYFSSTHNQ